MGQGEAAFRVAAAATRNISSTTRSSTPLMGGGQFLVSLDNYVLQTMGDLTFVIAELLLRHL